MWPDYVYLTTVIEVCDIVFTIDAVVVHPTVRPQIYDAISDIWYAVFLDCIVHV